MGSIGLPPGLQRPVRAASLVLRQIAPAEAQLKDNIPGALHRPGTNLNKLLAQGGQRPVPDASLEGEPECVLREEGVYSVNGRNELVWTLGLAPGEEIGLIYQYTVLVRVG